MNTCGECNYYCDERRICVLDSKFYFEGFACCEKYEANIGIDELDMMGYASDMESFE